MFTHKNLGYFVFTYIKTLFEKRTNLVTSDGGVSESIDVSLKDAGQTLLDDVWSNVQVLELKNIWVLKIFNESNVKFLFIIITIQFVIWKHFKP